MLNASGFYSTANSKRLTCKCTRTSSEFTLPLTPRAVRSGGGGGSGARRGKAGGVGGEEKTTTRATITGLEPVKAGGT